MIHPTGALYVNIPFFMLHEGHLEAFLRYRLNPEIGLDAGSLDRYSISEYMAIAERLRGGGLSMTLHGPFMDLSPGSPDPEVWKVTRRRFEKMLRLLPYFRPRSVVCHAGYDDRRYWHIKGLWLEKSVEMWTWLGARVGDEGACLMLENVYESDPEDLLVLFEQLEGRGIRFCLDAGHLAAFSRQPMETWISCLGTRVGQLHLHDNAGSRDDHLALGSGTIDFAAMFGHLKQVLRDPPIITLEPHREEDLCPSLECLKRIWPW